MSPFGLAGLCPRRLCLTPRMLSPWSRVSGGCSAVFAMVRSCWTTSWDSWQHGHPKTCSNMGMDQYLLVPFLGGWTSINPSYFDVNYRGTRFWPTSIWTSKLGVYHRKMEVLIKSLDEGFSTFSMVCACLNPPPCIKGAFFFPSSKVLVSQRYAWKTFPCSKDFSRPSVFPQWRFALKAAKKIKIKIKIPETNPYPGEEHLRPNIANMHKTCYVFFSMVCARLIFLKIFIFIFSPRRSRRGTLGISSPGGPVEEPLKPFCSFFSLRRLSSSVVFQWGSLRQTLDLSKTTNEKVRWRRPSI